MARLTVEDDWLALSVSSLEKRVLAKRAQREALFPRGTKIIFPLCTMPNPSGGPPWEGWVRAASVVPDAYQALTRDIPVWRVYPPRSHDVHISPAKVVIKYSWDTRTLAIVYGLHRPAVLVEFHEFVPEMVRRLVITVRDPESIVASIQAKLS